MIPPTKPTIRVAESWDPGIQDPTIFKVTVRYCPFQVILSVSVCFSPFQSFSVRFCLFLSISDCFCPFLSFSVFFCPFLSVSVLFCPCLSFSDCFCPFLSVSVLLVFFMAIGISHRQFWGPMVRKGLARGARRKEQKESSVFMF